MATANTEKKKTAKVKAPAGALSMKADMYTAEGKKAGTVDLPAAVFGVAWNDSLMHQVVTSMSSNARTPVAHVKDRGAVRGGGKKPWQQKGTGRARHGSTRSPIWKGGGVTHGPSNEKNYEKKIPRKMRAKALFMALSRKLHDGQILFVENFGFDVPKTAAAKKALASLAGIEAFKSLSTKRKNGALIAQANRTDTLTKSFRNFGSIESTAVRNLNPVEVLRYKYLIIEDPKAAIEVLAGRISRDKK